MVDTLAFLSKDYSEEEIHEIVDKVDTYVRFFGGDYAYLLKTNENTVYYGYIEDFEVPKEVVLEKISPEYRDLYEKYYQAEKEDNYEKQMKLLQADDYSEMYREMGEIEYKYRMENGGYEVTKYEPNKYVILARLHTGSSHHFMKLLEKMNVDCFDMHQWWSNEFIGENKPFDETGYEPKETPIANYMFWVDSAMSTEKAKTIFDKLIEELKPLHYGAYVWYGHLDMYTAEQDFTAKLAIADEYDKFLNYANDCLKEEFDKIEKSEMDDETAKRISDTVEQKKELYLKNHKIYEECFVKEGQLSFSLLILESEFDKVLNIIEKVGFKVQNHTLLTYDTYGCHEFLRDFTY